jgi:hypothetical protein
MLMQTNSYIVPKERRDEHTRLVQRFRQTLMRLGCDHFETYEQVGVRWSDEQGNGRFVQIMRFRDRKHQQTVEAAERNDPTAQALIREFCELVNLPYQQQQGLFAVGFYKSVLPPAMRTKPGGGSGQGAAGAEDPSASVGDQETASVETAQATLPRRVGFFPPPQPSVPPSAGSTPAGSAPSGSAPAGSAPSGSIGPGPISPTGAQAQARPPSDSDALSAAQGDPSSTAAEAGVDLATQIEPIDVAEPVDPSADGPTSLTWLSGEPQVNGQEGNGVAAPVAEATLPGHWVVSGEREVPVEPADDALIGDESKPAKAARRRKGR